MKSSTGAPVSAPSAHPPLLVVRDQRMLEWCLAAAAAAGVTPVVLRDPARVRAAWRAAASIVVSVEMAPLLCGMALEPRAGVHLVGQSMDELVTWSAPLQAAVVTLPEHSGTLTQVFEQGRVGGGNAVVVRLVGGTGGLGVSTAACALGQQAAARSLAAVVVEVDPGGGGLDLLFGAETAPGWRWHDLRAAAGHVDSLVGRLPNVSGVDVVSLGRPEDGSGEPPGADAVRAVVASLCRSHDLVVLDAGSGGQALLDSWPGQQQLLWCAADVRGVLGAQRRARGLGLHDVEVVVRRGAGRRIEPELVAESLGLPLAGWLGDDRALPRAAEAGVPAGRGRRGHARQVSRLLDHVMRAAGR